jgi:hypothetical protein
MQPMTVVTGIVLGSAFSIALGLAVVLLLFTILGSQYPQVAAERPGLIQSVVIFTVLTAVAGTSFVGLLRERWWRWYLQGLLWLLVLMVGLYYWP